MNTIEMLVEGRVLGDLQAPTLDENASESSSDILTSLELSEMISRGMQGQVLQSISQQIPRVVLAETVGADISNFAKLYRRTLTKPQTDEINDLTLLWSELRTFFEDDRALMQEWLEARVPALSGARPWDLITTFSGRQAIRKALDAMRYGDFA